MIYNAYQDTRNGISGISIVSSGHVFAQNGRRIYRPNGRNDFLLFYVAKGKEHFVLENDTVADEGSFIFFRPFERQEHFYKEQHTGEFYYVHFNAPPNFDLFGFESFKVYKTNLSTKVRDLFEEIITELQTKQVSYERICVAKLFNIFALLERKTVSELKPQTQYADKISFVIQTMNAEYERNYSLEDYAKMCSMSKFHFLRVFKEITGVSPIEYRNKIRLDHAKELLEDTNYTISEIGMRVGYLSNAYFCDAFKKKTGLSPSKFKKTMKHSSN